jgi:cell division protein ZipA
MDELRWILLGIGLLILAGIYYFADPAKDRRPRGWRIGRGQKDSGDADAAEYSGVVSGRRGPLDDEVEDEAMERELQRLGELINEDRQTDGGDHPQQSSDAHQAAPALDSEPEKIVALLLRPKSGARIAGTAIQQACEKVGLEYGEKQIFHRTHESGEEHHAVFSLADMVSPGSFNLDRINETSTPGLCLFMTLPNPLTALDGWDAMLAAGQRLADILGAELLDEAQSTLSRQRIAHIREEMREYDRRSEILLPPGH